MKPRSAVSSWANHLFRLVLWCAMLWPLGAAAQLDSTSFGPVFALGAGANYTFAVAAGDLDGDGFADLVVTNQCGLGTCVGPIENSSGIRVMINNRDGTFRLLDTPYTTGQPASSFQSVAIADVDGDGKLDVIVMNGDPQGGSVSVMRGNGDGTLQAAVSYSLNTATYSPPIFVYADKLTVADVNGDGKPDIIVSVSIDHTDLYFAEQYRAGVSVLLNNGDGTFASPVLYDSGGYAGARAVITADVNRDGFPDLVVLNLCSTPATSPNGTYCNDANTGQRQPGTVGVLLGNGDGTFQPAIVYPSGGYQPVGLAVADLNRDGNPDLLVANQCSNAVCAKLGSDNVSVLMGNPDGSFAAPANYDDHAVQPLSVAAGDIDGDGAVDVAVLNNCNVFQSCDGTTPIVAGMRGNGDGTLQVPAASNAPLYDVGAIYPHTVLLLDVNNDGKPDLVVGFWTGVGVRLNQTPRAVTTTTLDSQPNPSGDADTVTFTAIVSSSAPGVPGGTVTFREGAAILGTAPLVNAVATLDVSGLARGSHSVVASYSSDSAFRASDSAPLTQVVKASTSTSVDSSANPSTFQQSVTFTATVTAPLGGTPTGSVTFKDGATVLGSSPLVGNTAGFTTSSLSVGTHSVTAVYGGDAGDLGSTSAPLSQSVISKAATSTSVSSSLNPSVAGQTVTFTALVSSTGGVPTGTVTFKDGGTLLGGGFLNGSGQATFSTASLAAGTHAITAEYGGDTNFLSSTSSPLSQTVNQASTSTALASSPNPSLAGLAVTFTATVVSSAGGIPSGTVNFQEGKTLLGSSALNAQGRALFMTSSLSVGSHNVKAVYAGTASYAGSTSANLKQVVNPAPTTTSLTCSPNPVLAGYPVTFTVTVTTTSSGVPTGTVTLKDGGKALAKANLSAGQAVMAYSWLKAGTHSISATYSGDSNFAGSVSAVCTQVVN